MFLRSPSRHHLGELLLVIQTERLIAFGRLVFAAFAFSAIHLDPTQPARHSELAYLVLLSYFAYASALAALSLGRRPRGMPPLIEHAIDIGTLGVLMHLTEGPTSPFFVMFTFAVLHASLRWDWRGTIATGVLLLLVFLYITLFNWAASDGQDFDLNRLLVRVANLAVLTVLLAYFSAHRQSTRLRLSKLALWPLEDTADAEAPPLCRSLAHAAEVLQCARVLVAWEERGVSPLQCVLWTGVGCETVSVGLESGELIAAELETVSFGTLDPRAPWVRLSTGWRALPTAPVAEPVVRTLGIKTLVTAPFAGQASSGRVFVINPRLFSEDLLPLTEIVASRVRIEIEHRHLKTKLAASERMHERARMARDMHDGILQDLTAADLRLCSMVPGMPVEAQQPLREVRAMLRDQHDRIRDFVDASMPKPSSGDRLRGVDITRLTEKLSRNWGCEVSLEVDPAELELPGGTAYHLSLILTEAIANAVRHGRATAVRVVMGSSASSLEICISDNGTGIGCHGETADGVPELPKSAVLHSLRQRVNDLGGGLSTRSSADGFELSVRIPLPT